LLDQLNQPVAVGEREIAVGGTVGIAVYPADGDTAETLIAHAEAALDRLPASQETGYQFYTSAMHTASSDRLLLEQQLIEAVERNEFLLLYQPQISFASSRIVGMEALIRWRHPALGMVPPAEFIPLAEETPPAVSCSAGSQRVSRLSAWQSTSPAASTMMPTWCPGSAGCWRRQASRRIFSSSSSPRA
jgi:predicted signal transduction protein with EAL and GGDEF domain